MVGTTESTERIGRGAAPSRRGRHDGGFATITVLALVTVVALTLLFMFNASLAQLRLSLRGQNKATGLTLAEAGVEDAVDRLRVNPRFAGQFSGTLTEDAAGVTKTFGTFGVTVSSIAGGGSTRQVRSVGTNPDGTTETVVAHVNLDAVPLGKAAILANGDVKITGNASVDSAPVGLHIADVISNGNVNMGGSSYVDGRLIAAGTATGQANMGRQSGAPAYPFPDATTTSEWKSGWMAAAQAGGTKNANTIQDGDVITAPKYINGSISLNSHKTLTFSGSGVVFVNGDISLTAQATLQNGVLLVVNGTFSQTGQSVYQVTTGLSQTPTLVVYGSNSSVSSEVIKLAGGSSNIQQGVIYAVNGSIKVAGGSTFVGALVAGAPGAEVNVVGGYTHLFPMELASPVLFPAGASVMRIVEL